MLKYVTTKGALFNQITTADVFEMAVRNKVPQLTSQEKQGNTVVPRGLDPGCGNKLDKI